MVMGQVIYQATMTLLEAITIMTVPIPTLPILTAAIPTFKPMRNVLFDDKHTRTDVYKHRRTGPWLLFD